VVRPGALSQTPGPGGVGRGGSGALSADEDRDVEQGKSAARAGWRTPRARGPAAGHQRPTVRNAGREGAPIGPSPRPEGPPPSESGPDIRCNRAFVNSREPAGG